MAPAYRAHNSLSLASSTTAAFTKPTGTASGDKVLINLWINGVTQPNSTPTGFTKTLEEASGGTLMQLWEKIAGGSEPATYDFGWASAIIKGGGVVAVRSTTSDPLVTSDSAKQTNASSTNRQCPSVSPAEAATLVMFIVASVGQAMTADAASTERYDTGLGPRLYCMTEDVIAGPTGTRTATGLSSSSSQTISVAVIEDNTITATANITTDDATLDAAGIIANLGSADITTDDAVVEGVGELGSLALSPVNLTATALNRFAILLRWKEYNVPSTPLVGIKVERSLTGLGAWSEIADVAPGIQEYRDSGLTANTQYWYRIRSYTT